MLHPVKGLVMKIFIKMKNIFKSQTKWWETKPINYIVDQLKKCTVNNCKWRGKKALFTDNPSCCSQATLIFGSETLSAYEALWVLHPCPLHFYKDGQVSSCSLALTNTQILNTHKSMFMAPVFMCWNFINLTKAQGFAREARWLFIHLTQYMTRNFLVHLPCEQAN